MSFIDDENECFDNLIKNYSSISNKLNVLNDERNQLAQNIENLYDKYKSKEKDSNFSIDDYVSQFTNLNSSFITATKKYNEACTEYSSMVAKIKRIIFNKEKCSDFTEEQNKIKDILLELEEFDD